MDYGLQKDTLLSNLSEECMYQIDKFQKMTIHYWELKCMGYILWNNIKNSETSKYEIF